MTFRKLPEGVPVEGRGRILIVDDEPELTQALREMLSKQGYETTGFSAGRLALAALEEQSYDVLLVDLMMPEMDGIALLKKALELDPNLIGIIMTGQGTVQTAVEAMKSGAFDYILKPFKLNTVLAALSRSLEVRRLRTENLQLREMVNIYDLGQTVASRLDTGVILEKTAEAALQQCQADEVSILLPIPEKNELAIVTAYGDDRDYLVGQRVPIEGTIAGWVASHKEPVSLQGEVMDERFSAAYPRPEIRSSISMPMVLGKKLVGVLNVNMTHRRQPITKGQVRALSILVSIAASAMENARLHEQTEERLRRITALRTIDLAITSSLDLRVTLDIFLDQVAMQLSADAVAIWLVDPQSQSLEYAAGRGFNTRLLQEARILPGVGYAGEAALERRTVQAPDLLAAGLKPEAEQLIAEEGFRALFAAPLIAKGEVEGVLEVFQRAPYAPDHEWLQFLESLAGQAAIAIENSRLFDGLQRSNQQLLLAYNSTIEGWSRALDLRDRETEGHTQRVTEMTLRLARFIGGFDEDELAQIRRGALLHDIGKMGVPDDILLKPGPLSAGEWEIMRRHPDYAYSLLYPIAYLRKALDIPYLHHERWDGSGYPLGLRGRQIPLAGRIFAVVDVWDALRSDRPYRKGWPDEQVLRYIQEQAGVTFDPEVVQSFLQVL
ncbi:MAG TPA: HD domain-containing phosphohydrolase [Anaerolineales bacterium]